MFPAVADVSAMVMLSKRKKRNSTKRNNKKVSPVAAASTAGASPKGVGVVTTRPNRVGRLWSSRKKKHDKPEDPKHQSTIHTVPSDDSSWTEGTTASSAAAAVGGLLKVRTQKESLRRIYGVAAADDTGSPRNTVAFTQETVYYHAITLGDNPSVVNGPPIALGSERLGEETRDIDQQKGEEYVAEGDEKLPRRRRGNRLVISASERKRRLLDAGVPAKRIERAALLVKLRQQRKELEERRNNLWFHS